MKKLLSIILSIMSLVGVCFAFAGCGNNRESKEIDSSDINVSDSKEGDDFDYSAIDVSDIVEEDKRNMFELKEWRFTSGLPNNLIVCCAEEGVEFELKAGEGFFYATYGLDSKITVTANETVKWYSNGDNEMQAGEKTYIEVTAKQDDKNIGYGLIEVYCIKPNVFKAYVLKSALFPETDGEPQAVSDEQVKALIAQCKAVDVSTIVEEEQQDMFEFNGWSSTTETYDRFITCKGEEGVEFELFVYNGYFEWNTKIKNVFISAGTQIKWSDCTDKSEYLQPQQGTHVDVTLRKGGKIIGYGIIQIECVAVNVYKSSVLKSVIFPETDGKPQAVTVVQVNKLIAQRKEKFEDDRLTV